MLSSIRTPQTQYFTHFWSQLLHLNYNWQIHGLWFNAVGSMTFCQHDGLPIQTAINFQPVVVPSMQTCTPVDKSLPVDSYCYSAATLCCYSYIYLLLAVCVLCF